MEPAGDYTFSVVVDSEDTAESVAHVIRESSGEVTITHLDNDTWGVSGWFFPSGRPTFFAILAAYGEKVLLVTLE